MPSIVKVREHSSTSDNIIHHETSADIVKVNTADLSSITGDNVQEIIKNIDIALDDCETTLTTTIIAKNFTSVNDHYEQKIMIDGVKETDNPIVGLLMSGTVDDINEQMDSWGCIQRITCGSGFITVYCYDDLPEIDITVQIKIVR